MPSLIRRKVSKRTGKVTWTVQLGVGVQDDGRPKYLIKTFAKKAEAKEYLLQRQQDLGRGMPVEPSKLTLDEYLDQWVASLRANKSVRTNTLESYESVLKLYIRPHLGERQLDDIKALAIQGVVTKLGEPKLVRRKLTDEERKAGESDTVERFLAPRTIRYAVSVLSKALKQAVRWRILAYNPAADVDLPCRQRREMAALTPEQGRALLQAVEGHRFEALFKLAIATGMRPSEYRALKWSDLDLAAGQAIIQRTVMGTKDGWEFADTKTDQSRRALTLHEPVVEALRAHKARQGEERLKMGGSWNNLDLVFPNEVGEPMDHKNLLRRYFRPLLKKAGLPLTIRLYDLRHTCATLMLVAGVQPKVMAGMLGHTSIRTTMDTYSHVLPDMTDDAAKKVGDLLFKPA